MSFNPFLQDLHLPIPGPVYWAPGRHLLWYDPHGHRSTRRLDPAEVSSWCADRDPSVLWEQWSQLLAGHRFLVEHTSVNPVHPLHAGSLRGTVLGGAITGLLRSAGADVDVRYFVNDQGRQVTYLRRILPEVDWHTIPTGLRPDEAVGILYALANMREAARHTDIARLVGEHPWLRSAVATSAPLPTTVPEDDLGVVKTMVDCAAQDLHLLGADADSYDYESQLPDDTGALVPKPNPAYDPRQAMLLGWVPKFCQAEVRGDALEVIGNGRMPFIANVRFSASGPLEVRLRLRSDSAGEGRVQWRGKNQQEFPATGQTWVNIAPTRPYRVISARAFTDAASRTDRTSSPSSSWDRQTRSSPLPA